MLRAFLLPVSAEVEAIDPGNTLRPSGKCKEGICRVVDMECASIKNWAGDRWLFVGKGEGGQVDERKREHGPAVQELVVESNAMCDSFAVVQRRAIVNSAHVLHQDIKLEAPRAER